MRMSAKLRAELRKYNEDLLERVRMVACPSCGSVPGVKCKSRQRWTAYSNGCHGSRHWAAKRAGFVKGTKGGKPAA
jgi:hypothetical protein